MHPALVKQQLTSVNRRLIRCIEAESDTVDSLKVHVGVGLEMLPELGDKYIHTSSQEIVIFAPYVKQHLFAS